jgi:two-component system, sensor histidine kinase and response regulator
VQYASASQNVTDHMEMEPALREELHMMRTLMEMSSSGVYFKDRDSRYLKINAVWAVRLGLASAQEALGKTDADFLPLEYAQAALADEQEIMRTGTPITAKEQREFLPNGDERWVSITKMPLYDLEGHVTGTFGITRDITEHKRAEEAATFESYLLSSLMDNLPDSFYFK